MRDRTRAHRRHHRKRMENHARFIIKNIQTPYKEDAEWVERSVQRRADNFQSCSCRWACGHRREVEGAPIREKRHEKLNGTPYIEE